MPTRRSSSRRSRRTTPSRRRTVRFSRRPASRRPTRRIRAAIPTGVPSHQLIKLRYAETLVANGINSALPAVATYGMNTIFDPQFYKDFSSVSGHQSNAQPLYRDQWAAFYYKSRVFGVKATITWAPYQADITNTPASTVGTMAVYPADFQNTDSDVTITSQRTNCRVVQYGGILANQQRGTVKMYVKPWKALGLSKRQYTDDPLTAGNLNSGANPTTASYLNIVIQNMSTAQALYGYLQIRFTYYVHLFDRIENIGAS